MQQAHATSRAVHSANRTTWRTSCGRETATDASLDALIRRYNGFVRLKASSYFLAGGDGEDLQQEGLIGLYKAIRDYRVDKDTSFRSFAELCITRQIITAIKGATRFKHGPLNGYISFSHTPAGQDPDSGDCTIGDTLAASNVHDPANRVISSEGLEALVGVLGASLSKLEAQVLALFMEGESYEIDRRAAQLRREGRRQRAPAREAQGRHASRRARLTRRTPPPFPYPEARSVLRAA